MKKVFFMLGRICLSLIFICSVANQFLNWDLTQHTLDASLSKWIVYPGLSDQIQKVFNLMLSYSSLLLIIWVIFAALGGLLVLLGLKIRLGAILLILALIPVTVIMNAFWMSTGSLQQLEMEMFLKNLSILGGLFILASCSNGGEE